MKKGVRGFAIRVDNLDDPSDRRNETEFRAKQVEFRFDGEYGALMIHAPSVQYHSRDGFFPLKGKEIHKIVMDEIISRGPDGRLEFDGHPLSAFSEADFAIKERKIMFDEATHRKADGMLATIRSMDPATKERERKEALEGFSAYRESLPQTKEWDLNLGAQVMALREALGVLLTHVLKACPPYLSMTPDLTAAVQVSQHALASTSWAHRGPPLPFVGPEKKEEEKEMTWEEAQESMVRKPDE